MVQRGTGGPDRILLALHRQGLVMTESVTQRTASRPLTASVLFAVTAICWAYLILLRWNTGDMSATGPMNDMGATGVGRPAFSMPMTSSWTAGDIVLMWTMWAVMMAAMMTPSAMPMIHAYNATIQPGSDNQGSTPLFVAGYLLAWSGFAAVATAAQWGLHDVALVDSMGVSTDRWVAGAVLLIAGAYQFTGAKDACLGRCRTPLGFLLSEWRPGRRGALAMGIHHGSLCIGCCWALMALLFVLGVMNLWWIATVATIVLIEKTTRSSAVPRVIGLVLLVWAALVLIGVVEMGASK